MKCSSNRYSFIYLTGALVFFSVLTARAESTWIEDERESGCIRYKGKRQTNLLPIKVICTWEISARALHRVLSKPEDFEHCFSRVKVSNRISTAGQLDVYRRVFQVHDASPLRDRGLYLDYRLSQRDERWRLSFQLVLPPQATPLDDNLIPVKQNYGYWEVKETDLGTQVTMESFYDPGGSVPNFLVRWFVGSGVQKMMDELKECALLRLP